MCISAKVLVISHEQNIPVPFNCSFEQTKDPISFIANLKCQNVYSKLQVFVKLLDVLEETDILISFVYTSFSDILLQKGVKQQVGWDVLLGEGDFRAAKFQAHRQMS